jgi:hypothetical protein
MVVLPEPLEGAASKKAGNEELGINYSMENILLRLKEIIKK